MVIMTVKSLKSTLKVRIILKMQRDAFNLGLVTCVVTLRTTKQSVDGMVVIAV